MNCKFGLSLDLIKFSRYLIFVGKDIHLVPVIIGYLGYWQSETSLVRLQKMEGWFSTFKTQSMHISDEP